MSYWENRYSTGGNSGAGSRGSTAQLKARLVNAYIEKHRISEVLDIGCGDGYVARLLKVPDYLGVDIAPFALALAQERNPTRAFALLDNPEPREAHLSFDVLHHLMEDDDYQAHLDLLFSAKSYALVWASDRAEAGAPHVLHRHWTPDVPEDWTLDIHTAHKGAGFYAYRR